MTEPKYEGPFESQEEEDAAVARYERVRKIAADKKAAADLAEEAERKKKKGKLLPIVE